MRTRATYCCSILANALGFVLLASSVVAQEAPLRSITIEQPRTIDGVPCGPTGTAKARLYQTGTLESCPLAVDHTMQDLFLRARTWVYLDRAGGLTRAWLSENTRIQNHTCKGSGYDNWITEFHAGGGLKLCYLAEEETIQGVPCRKGSLWGEISGGVKVIFHENGMLESCSAARSFSLAGRNFKKRARVQLDANGQLIQPATRLP